MNKDIKSRGRKKKVTSGGNNVHKKQRVGTGRPVGSNSTYSKKKKQAKSQSYSQQSQSQGASTSSTRAGGMSLKKLLFFAVIIIVGYFILKNMGMISTEPMDMISGGFDQAPSGSTSSDQALSQGELDTTVSDLARSKYTQIVGDGNDVYTIMIYMCGSDLESRGGMATADLNEILHADIADNVNIIVETGGASSWKNSTISNRSNQRYKCTDEGLVLVQDNLGRRSMTEPGTLSDFIKFSKKNYPADRYSLIFWDHGGGSNQGFGHDEFASGTTMTLNEIDTALSDGGCRFDFVGFDACLMATYETAMMLDKHSDYLLASEETEPGTGWYYTDWISNLSHNTSMSTLEIAKNIIDDFTRVCIQNNPNEKTTLSMVDLAELSGTVPQKFKSFASSTSELIDSEEYKIVADARGGSREFGAAGRLDQIDLIHFAQNINTPEADELVAVIDQCVKYNRSSRTVPNANGLSIYFPYARLSALDSMLDTYDEIGMDEEYSDCIKNFANLEIGGQGSSSGTTNALETLLGSLGQSAPVNPPADVGGDLVGTLLNTFISSGGLEAVLGGMTGMATDSSWVDTDKIMESQSFYEQNRLAADDISLTTKDGGYVLAMQQQQWDLVQNICLNIFVDDGEGFIDLGLDNVYEFDNDGDLVVDYDGTWIAINGQVVSYYLVSEATTDDDYIITGRVPCMLNGELVDLVLIFNNENEYGQVVGAQYMYEDSATIAKGLMEIEDGDKLEFICDYYTYDQQYEDSYYLGEEVIVDGDLVISNVSVGSQECIVTYQLTDIYNNTYWTPALQYK